MKTALVIVSFCIVGLVSRMTAPTPKPTCPCGPDCPCGVNCQCLAPVPVKDNKACPDCEGKGGSMVFDFQTNGQKWMDCDRCDGEGRLP